MLIIIKEHNSSESDMLYQLLCMHVSVPEVIVHFFYVDSKAMLHSALLALHPMHSQMHCKCSAVMLQRPVQGMNLGIHLQNHIGTYQLSGRRDKSVMYSWQLTRAAFDRSCTKSLTLV